MSATTLRNTLVTLVAALFIAPSFASAQEPTSMPAVEATAGPAADAALFHGTWDVNFEPMIATLPPGEQAMARQMMGAMSMTLTVTPEGGFTMNADAMGETQSESGTYSVTSAEGSTLTISMTATESTMPSGPDTTTLIITFSDENNFSAVEQGMENMPDATIYFQRQQ